MGYVSQFEGEIAISPPLNAAEVRAARDDMGTDPLLKILVEETVTFILEDELMKQQGVAVIPAAEDMKGYHFVDQLRALVAGYPDHEFHGTIVRTGEEQPDMERYVATGHEVRVEKAVMTWPDGTVVSS